MIRGSAAAIRSPIRCAAASSSPGSTTSHDGADTGIRVQFPPGGWQAGDHRRVHGVGRMRAVEDQPAELPAALECQPGPGPGPGHGRARGEAAGHAGLSVGHMTGGTFPSNHLLVIR
jgi:hypothetical protein